jgi:hypothetical protein
MLHRDRVVSDVSDCHHRRPEAVSASEAKRSSLPSATILPPPPRPICPPGGDRAKGVGWRGGRTNALERQHHRPDKLNRGCRTNRTVSQLADARSLFSTGAEQAKIRFHPGGEFVQARAYACVVMHATDSVISRQAPPRGLGARTRIDPVRVTRSVLSWADMNRQAWTRHGRASAGSARQARRSVLSCDRYQGSVAVFFGRTELD